MSAENKSTIHLIHTPSTVRHRLYALLYDSLIGFSILMISTVALQAIHYSLTGMAAIGNEWWFTAALYSAIASFTSFFWVHSGQTLGMLAWRIRLVSEEGKKLTVKQAFMRFVYATLFVPLGLSYVWCIFDKKGYSLQDRLTQTRVVTLPKRD